MHRESPKESSMILRYSRLCHKPAIFKAMTGLTVALFDELVWELGPAYA